MTVDVNVVRPRITMTVFSYAGVYPKTHECVIQEIMYAVQRGIHLQYNGLAGGAHLCKSRSHAITTWFREQDTDANIMIDHDMDWNPGDAIETANLSHRVNAVCACLYAKKGFGAGHTCCNVSGETTFNIGGGEHRAIPCDRLATGFMAIPRTVMQLMWDKLNVNGPAFQEMWKQALKDKDDIRLHTLAAMGISECIGDKAKEGEKPTIDMFRCMRLKSPDGNWVHLSEDFSFCERLRFVGSQPMLNARPWITHHGNYAFDPNCGKGDHPLAPKKAPDAGTGNTAPSAASGQQAGSPAVQK